MTKKKAVKDTPATQAEQTADNLGLTPGKAAGLDAVTPQPEQVALSPEVQGLAPEPVAPEAPAVDAALAESAPEPALAEEEKQPEGEEGVEDAATPPAQDLQADAALLNELPDFTEEDKPMIDAIDGAALTPDDIQAEPTSADEYNGHPALAPNGNAILHGDVAKVPAGTLGGGVGTIEEDTEGVDEDGNDVLVKAGTRVEEEASDDPFDSEEVRKELAGLNDESIIAKGEGVKVKLGSQPELSGTVQGHTLQDSLVYHVSFQIAPANFIQNVAEQSVVLPIPAEYVSR